MINQKTVSFLIACVIALGIFVAYQSFYGGENNQAYASLSEEELVNGRGVLVNYKPARKRQLSSRLRNDADNIFDLKGHDIAQVFDAPELVRRDLPTTIWQYRNAHCVMDVYFTVGRKDDVARANVAHYEVRRRDVRSQDALSVSDCMGELIAHDTMISLINVDAIFKSSEE